MLSTCVLNKGLFFSGLWRKVGVMLRYRLLQPAVLVNQINNIAMLRKGPSRCTSFHAYPMSSLCVSVVVGGVAWYLRSDSVQRGEQDRICLQSNKEAIGARPSLRKKIFAEMPRKRQYQPANRPTHHHHHLLNQSSRSKTAAPPPSPHRRTRNAPAQQSTYPSKHNPSGDSKP
jgi:hypothetical protein